VNGRTDMADGKSMVKTEKCKVVDGTAMTGNLELLAHHFELSVLAFLRHAAKTFSFPRRLDVRMIRPWLRTSAGCMMLDVGCGDGYWTARLARLCGARACGIEVDASAVAAARREHPEHAWRVGRAEDLPFPDGAFDLVVSLSVIQFIADAGRALREMRRVLRPGGRLILTADAMDWPGISPGFLRLHRRKYRVAAYWPLERLRPAVEEAGFTVRAARRAVSSRLASRIMHLEERCGKAAYAAAPLLYPAILTSDALAGGPGGHKVALEALAD